MEDEAQGGFPLETNRRKDEQGMTARRGYPVGKMRG